MSISGQKLYPMARTATIVRNALEKADPTYTPPIEVERRSYDVEYDQVGDRVRWLTKDNVDVRICLGVDFLTALPDDAEDMLRKQWPQYFTPKPKAPKPKAPEIDDTMRLVMAGNARKWVEKLRDGAPSQTMSLWWQDARDLAAAIEFAVNILEQRPSE